MQHVSSLIFLALVIAVLLLAAWLRLDRLDAFPPGISGDEAFNTVDAFVLAQTGKLPLYEDLNRPEHLHRAILAVGVRLYGASVWAFRFTNVLIGVLTVAAAYWAARQCTGDQPGAVRGLAGLAAAGSLAGSMSHVVLSRSLYRADLLPLFVLLFVGFALRGLKPHPAAHAIQEHVREDSMKPAPIKPGVERSQRRDLILAGVSLGLALHSYTAGLVMPVGLGALALGMVIARPRQWRAWLPGLLWIALAFAMVAAPVAGMLWIDQDRVLSRAGDVTGERSFDDLRARFERVWDGMIERGDINSQYNADYAPTIPPLWHNVFYLGLLALVVRARHPSSPVIAALLVAGMAPVALSNEIPHGLRIAGEHAVYPLVIAVGVAFVLVLLRALLREVQRVIAVPRLQTAGLALAGVAILSGTVFQARDTHRTYFAWWDNNDHPWRVYGRELQHGEWFFRGDHRALGEWLSAQDGPLLVPAFVLNFQTVRTWLLDAYPNVEAVPDMIALPPDTRAVFPWVLEIGDIWAGAPQYALLHGDTITILPPLTESARAALSADINAADTILRENGDPLLQVLPVPAGWDAEIMPRANPNAGPLVVFEDGAQIAAWRGPDTLSGGDSETIIVALDWGAAGGVNHFYSAFVQLQTQDYDVIARDEAELWRWLYPPPLWESGSAIPTPYALHIPAGLAPGAYRLAAGLYLGPYPELRQDVRESRLGAVDNMATVAWIKVPQPPPAPLNDPAPLDAVFADSFALTGMQAARLDDGTVQVTLAWESRVQRPAIDATIFIHVLDRDGNLVTQSDIRPAYPTFIWDRGERVHTVHALPVGDADPAGLRLVAGMYSFPGPARLSAVQDGTPAPNDLIALGTLAEMFE